MTVNRTTSQVTAALANTGTVGVSFAVYPDAYLPSAPTPVTVLPSAPAPTPGTRRRPAGKYAFSVYGPDGFLTSFAGTVVPAGRPPARSRSSPPPCGPAAKTVELTLANRAAPRSSTP